MLNRMLQEERSQGVVRIGLVFATIFTTTLFYLNQKISFSVVLTALYVLVYSVVLFIILYRDNKTSDHRRFITNVLDNFCVAYTIYLAGDIGILYTFVLLWMAVGCGMRFGSRDLIRATIVSLLFFSLLVFFSDHWQSKIYTTLSTYLLLLIIPMYVLRLTNRLSKISEEIKHAATHDHLSGLLNRDMFYKTLNQRVDEVVKNKGTLMIMYLDLDGFKIINDELGHKYGDIVIQEVSERLKNDIRESDTLSRLGGDEFGVILYGVDNDFNIKYCAQKILDKISEPITAGNAQLQVTASIGISAYPQNGSNPEELTHSADKAMYISKSEGKNKYTFAFNM